jgi:ectoine hydroxylase-related dioxygenase (phytanoyl-CoA dioxygenase family)
MLDTKYKDDYWRDGFVVIPNVFVPDEVELIRQRANEMALAPDASVQRLLNGHPALLFWPRNTDAVLAAAVDDRRLGEIVEGFVGCHARQINNQVYFRQSGDGDQFGWHQDIVFRVPKEDFDGVEENYLQTIICVDAMGPDSGAIEFIPGSHRLGNLNLLKSDVDPALRRFVRGDRYGTKICASPGDVIVWHSLVIHGSEPNESGRPRMTYMNGFAAGHAVRNKKLYPLYQVRN